MSRASSRFRPVPIRRAPRRFRPDLVSLEGRALLSTITVTSTGDSGAGTLRQAIASASPGDTINFAPSLDGGTISLTSGPLAVSEDLTIRGPGAGSLTVDGGGKQQIFAIQPSPLAATTPPPKVAIDGLTLADGLAPSGGAILAIQTDLSLDGDAFVNNAGSQDAGGAIVVFPGFYGYTNQGQQQIVAGSLTITGSSFLGNTDQGGGGGALASYDTPTTISGGLFQGNSTVGFGGAIDHFQQANPLGTLTIDGTLFDGNQSNSPGIALGGAIFNEGTATVTNSTFSNDQAIGPDVAQGGAIHDGFGAVLTVSGTTFANDQAISAGQNGTAAGGAISGDPGSSLTIGGSTFLGNVATAGGTAQGGAVKNYGAAGFGAAPIGTTISSSTFLSNRAVGLDASTATGNSGGSGSGGAVFNGPGFLTLSGSSFVGNQAVGGSGGAKGFGNIADGGAVVNESPLTLTGTTFLSNTAQGGSGGLQAGFAVGGGISQEFDDAPTASTIANSLFDGNQAIGGAGTGASVAGGFAQGGGLNIIEDGGPVNLTGVTVADNSAIGGAGGPAGSSTSASGGAGGPATGGGLSAIYANVTIAGGSFVANLAKGGNAPAGVAGAGQGGAIYQGTASNTLTLSGVTVLSNEARGGDGLSGGNGEGGGLWIAGIVSVADGVVSLNGADGGSAGSGLGGGAFVAKGGKLTVGAGTPIVGNHASTAGPDLYQA